MPRLRIHWESRPSMPPAFFALRDEFRAARMDLWADAAGKRYIARNKGVVIREWRTLADARAWLNRRPALRSVPL